MNPLLTDINNHSLLCAFQTWMEGHTSFVSEPAPMKFHSYHGRNINLLEYKTVAYRTTGYAYAITFSSRHLAPGEIFLLEIEKYEAGWIGNLKLGLTQMDPSTGFALPQYALPGLPDSKTWIVPITSDLSPSEHRIINDLSPSIYESHDTIFTSRGSIPRCVLQPTRRRSLSCAHSDGEESVASLSSYSEESLDDQAEHMSDMLSADVGSRIGVTYVIQNNCANMYIIINGYVFGPCATNIPYKDGRIYAVADLYGTTKQVRIVQTYSIPSLKCACRNTILQRVSNTDVFHLPLPKLMIDYLTK